MNKTTVVAFLKDWLTAQKPLLQQSTYEAYKIYLGRHIVPYFDSIGTELENLTPMQILTYTRVKLTSGRLDGKAGGLSLVSVKKHLSILRQALNDAVAFGYIQSNPAIPIRLPKRKNAVSERTVMLTVEEAQRVIDAFKGHNLFPAVVVTLYYGLRRSEILGLRWSSIDFENNKLTIEHTVVKNLTIVEKDSVKSKSSKRTFELIPEIRELLLKVKAERTVDSEYICAWADGRLMRPDYVTRGFQRVLKTHGLKRMRFHDLRHSTASILFGMGWSLEDVKQWLGHSDIETTSNIYLHYGRTRQILVAKDLSGKLKIT